MPDNTILSIAFPSWPDSSVPGLLAQDGAVGMPGAEGSPVAAAPSADAGGAAPAPSSPFSPGFMLLIVGFFVLMIIMTSLGPRRERKRREEMINSVKKHDRVQTVGGVIGAIVELKPDFVVLKVDESANTRITFARSAIQQVLSRDERDGEPAKEK